MPSLPTLLLLFPIALLFADGTEAASLSASIVAVLFLAQWRIDVLSDTVAKLSARLDAIRGQGGGGT